jgi:hypothetical protein
MDTQAPRQRHFEGVHCALTIQQLSAGVVVLKISGTDIGEFGNGPMLAIEECLSGEPIHLFIDARDVRGASIAVSGEWAKWLQLNKAALRDIHMLTGSRLVEVTASFVRSFAALRGIMKIYTEPAVFDAVLTASIA